MTETAALDFLIDRYIAIWNETDPAERRDLIARTWTEDATYLDPLMRGDGPAGIDAMVAGVQARFPGHRFRRTGPIDAHHDRLRFGWDLVAADGQTPIVAGLESASSPRTAACARSPASSTTPRPATNRPGRGRPAG